MFSLLLTFAAVSLQADPEAAHQFEITEQSLSAALESYSKATGIDVAAPSDLLEGKQAPALSGNMSAREALNALLADSGLEAEFTGDQTAGIMKAGTMSTPNLEDPEIPELDQTIVNAVDPVVAPVPRQNSPPPPPPIEETIEPEPLIEPLVIDDFGFRAAETIGAMNVAAPLIETPAVVNTLNREFLDIVRPRSLQDYVDYVPGAASQSQGETFLGPKVNIRGFEINSRFSNSVNIDGFSAPRRSYHFDRSIF
ncbi:MAG: secretin and TonB N-terminal domain-containing protein, partial [Verrucomicrobiota bacterium]